MDGLRFAERLGFWGCLRAVRGFFGGFDRLLRLINRGWALGDVSLRCAAGRGHRFATGGRLCRRPSPRSLFRQEAR